MHAPPLPSVAAAPSDAGLDAPDYASFGFHTGMPYTAYRYLVLSPVVHPVAAREGDVLVVRPGHPTRPIAVVRFLFGAWQFVRSGPPNYGAIVGLELDGVLATLAFSAPSLAEHPLARSA